MSKIALAGNASGTGTFTIASPNSNNNLTLTLPTVDGTSGQVLQTNGSGVLSFVTVTVPSPSGSNIFLANQFGGF